MVVLVVVAPPPVRVAHDGLPSHLVERDLHGRVPVSGGDRDDRGHHLRVGGDPLQSLHPAHGAAGDGQEALDAQRTHQQLLSTNHVGHGHDGKAEAVRPTGGRIGAARAAGAATAADHIRADHEVLVGIEGSTGAHHHIPPAGLAVALVVAGGVSVTGQGVEEKDGVRTLGIQRAVGLVGHGERRERQP